MLYDVIFQLPVNIFDDEFSAYDEVDGKEVVEEEEEKLWSVRLQILVWQRMLILCIVYQQGHKCLKYPSRS